MEGIQFKKIRGTFLIALGIVLMLLLLWGSSVLVFFLVKRLEQALTFEPPATRATEFDTQGFEKLNLLQTTRK